MMKVDKVIDIHKIITRNLNDRYISQEEANKIINAACSMMPPVKLVYTNEYRGADLGFIKKCLGFKSNNNYSILGESNVRDHTITLYSGGHVVSTLLHELAHIFPVSLGHGKSWQESFKRLVEWYNDWYATRD
jgi:hypothetical protein